MFMFYAFFDMIFILIIFSWILYYGVQCNLIDRKFMTYFQKLRDEAIKFKTEAERFSMYKS